jgi:hypothetical protein
VIRIHTLPWTVLAIALSSGWLSLAGAQQPDRAPMPGGEIQLYSLPLDTEVAPMWPNPPPEPPVRGDMAPQPRPGVGYQAVPPAPASASPPYSDDDFEPGWLPLGGTVQVQSDRDVGYASGGVGESERAELNALSGQFNLKLLFAMQGSGDYLADVQVNVLDARGALVLSTPSQGPWFLAQLPSGAYTVEVAAFGQTQRQTVRIDGSRQARLHFYWR